MEDIADGRSNGRAAASLASVGRGDLELDAAATRTVAFLFCDMVGSTELLARRGLTISEDVRRRFYAVLRDAIGANSGEEVKSTGDGLMVAFPSRAGNAVACAISMQRAVSRLGLELPHEPVALRVGVACGEAVAAEEEADWYGLCVVVAARLCATAPAGQILASAALVESLRSPVPPTTPRGTLQLKGVPDPHPTVTIEWSEPATSRSPVPLPIALDGPAEWPLRGRESELTSLVAAWREAISDRSRVVEVLGEPGVGTSALVRTLARQLHQQGAIVLHSSVGHGEPVPLAALGEAVRWFVATASTERLRRDLRDVVPDLLTIVPGLSSRLRGLPRRIAPLDGDACAGMADLICAAARQAPTLLVIDDAHAASAATRSVLASLGGRSVPLLVLGVGHAGASIALTAPADVIHVAGLAAGAVADVVADIAGPVSPDALIDIVTRVGGNARDVVDLAHAFASSGVLDDAAVRRALDSICPYRGLAAFAETDQSFFFGREAVVASIVSKLTHSRLVTVVGASGAGKSSIIHAGVVPTVLQQTDCSDWKVISMVPGDDPIAQLAGRLGDRADVSEQPDALRAELLTDANGFDRLARRLACDGQRILLVVDQLEELFTTCDGSARELFLRQLQVATASPGGPVTALVAIRGDFYGRLADVPGFAAALEADQVVVGPMSEAELGRAIKQPASGAGLRLEEGLVETIVADVTGQPGGLPLLSHALLETWKRRRGRTLTLAGYREAGGVRGAVARTAELVYGQLGSSDQRALKALFLRAVNPGDGAEDTRRKVALDELPVDLAKLVTALVNARLLASDDTTVEVAHEALIREWPRLRDWLDEGRDALRVHRQLTATSRTWSEHGEDPSELYQGTKLALLERWVRDADPVLNAAETRFVAASQRRAIRMSRRRRVLVSCFGVLTAVALVAASVAYVQQRRATRSAARADSERLGSEVRRLSFEAQVVAPAQPDLAMLLAVEARRQQQTPETAGALLAALTAAPGIRQYADIGLSPSDRGWPLARRGHTLVVESHDAGGLIVVDAESLQPTGVVIPADETTAIAVSFDGAEVATSDAVGAVRRWDVASGAERAPRLQPSSLPPPDSIKLVDYLPDGTLIVANANSLDLFPRGVATSQSTFATPGAADHLAVSSTGSSIAVSTHDEKQRAVVVTLIDRRTMTGRTLSASDSVTAMSFIGDYWLLVAGETPFASDQQVRAFTVASGQVAAAPLALSSAADGIFAADDETVLLQLRAGGYLVVGNGLRVTHQVHPFEAAVSTTLLDSESLVAVQHGRLVIIDRRGRGSLVHAVMAGPSPLSGKVSTSADGDRLLALSDGEVQVYDASTMTYVGPRMTPIQESPNQFGGFFDAAISADGRRVALVEGTRLELVDLATERRVAIPSSDNRWARFSPDSASLAITDGSDLAVLDADSGKTRWSRSIDKELRPALPEWSPDGTLLAVQEGPSGGLFILNAVDGTTLARWPDTTTLAFTPDSKTAAVFGTELQLIDPRSGKVLRTLIGHREVALGVFSADGSTLVTFDVTGSFTGAGAVEVIDVANAARVGSSIPVDIGGPLPPTLSLASSRLYLSGINAPVTAIELSPDVWMEAACRVAHRNLTSAEWKRYLSFTGTYHETCPQVPLSK